MTVVLSQRSTDLVVSYLVSWDYEGFCPGLPPNGNGSCTLDGTERMFTVNLLQPNSQYSLNVEAINNQGSAASQFLVQTNTEGTPVQSNQL